jgi:L-glyceraldehyde 3-phosphate reductase
VRTLAGLAKERGQRLAQLALAWALRDPRMTSLVIGASSVDQLETNLASLDNLALTVDELTAIDEYATDADINLWAASSNA